MKIKLKFKITPQNSAANAQARHCKKQSNENANSSRYERIYKTCIRHCEQIYKTYARHHETKRSFVVAIHKFMSAKFKALMNLKNKAANALNLRNLKLNILNLINLNALNSTNSTQIIQTTQIQIPQRANNGI